MKESVWASMCAQRETVFAQRALDPRSFSLLHKNVPNLHTACEREGGRERGREGGREGGRGGGRCSLSVSMEGEVLITILC